MLEGYTKAHKDIPVGSSVVVQNKAGKFPRKWVKTGIVVENMDYDKVLVKLDGSGRLTSRNIKNVKKIVSPPDEPMEVVPVVEKSTDNRDTSRENIFGFGFSGFRCTVVKVEFVDSMDGVLNREEVVFC